MPRRAHLRGGVNHTHCRPSNTVRRIPHSKRSVRLSRAITTRCLSPPPKKLAEVHNIDRAPGYGPQPTGIGGPSIIVIHGGRFLASLMVRRAYIIIEVCFRSQELLETRGASIPPCIQSIDDAPGLRPRAYVQGGRLSNSVYAAALERGSSRAP